MYVEYYSLLPTTGFKGLYVMSLVRDWTVHIHVLLKNNGKMFIHYLCASAVNPVMTSKHEADDHSLPSCKK